MQGFKELQGFARSQMKKPQSQALKMN